MCAAYLVSVILKVSESVTLILNLCLSVVFRHFEEGGLETLGSFNSAPLVPKQNIHRGGRLCMCNIKSCVTV